MKTGTTKDYQLVSYNISDRTSIVFEVKTCVYCHVLLLADPNDNNNSGYEIIIGKPSILFFIRKR